MDKRTQTPGLGFRRGNSWRSSTPAGQGAAGSRLQRTVLGSFKIAKYTARMNLFSGEGAWPPGPFLLRAGRTEGEAYYARASAEEGGQSARRATGGGNTLALPPPFPPVALRSRAFCLTNSTSYARKTPPLALRAKAQ